MESSLEVTFVLDHGTYFAQRCSQPVKVNRPSFPQSSKTNAEDKPFKWSPSIWSCTVQALFEYRRIVCDLFGDPGKICIILVDDCCRTLDAKFLHSDETLDEWLKTNGAFTLKENENGPSILSGIKMAIDRMDMENTGKAIPTNCPNRIITITHFKDEAEVKKLLDEVYNHMLTVPTRSDFEICLINTYPDKVDGAVKPMQSNTVQFFQNRKLAIRLFVDKELCWLVDHQKDCNAHIDWLYEVKDLNDDGSQKEERPYSTLPEVTYLPEIGNIGMMSLQESNAADSWSQADGSPWCNFTSVHNMRQNTLHVYLYNCEAGAPLFNKIYQIVQRHYDLASLTVCNIPMKEEVSEAESGSKPYNVELLHPRKVLEDVWKAGLVRNNGTIYVTAANSTYMTFKVNWGSVWRSHEKDLQFSTMAVPCTPVSINQRETMCLTNYILSGRIVLICVDLPDDGRIYTHALVSRNGRLYVQSLQIGRSSFEMLPSRKNGPGTAVTDYRVNAFQELIEDSLLKPGGPTIPKGTAEKYLIEITEYWPINNSSSVLFALSSRLEPLLSHMRKKILTECDQEECRRVLLDINTSSLKNEPLPMGNCKKMAGMTALVISVFTEEKNICMNCYRKQQYSVLWAELNKYVSTYAHHSKAHESLLVALQQVTQKSGTVQKESKQSSIQKLKTAAHQMELIEQALADEAGLLCGDDDGELGEVAGKQSLLDYCSQVHDEEHYTKWRDFEGRVAMNAGGEVILYRNLGNKADKN
ncbi:Protein asunder -like protein [Trichinella zimbabwensis]|uniref:Protein asunder n=1 Tax=Trichinella zimbabwensis TaxID=268475 RepID=A0A0V1HWA8_9BILA|nr:Protein asunder -like protein [Trichinella zimbabwensis]